MGQMINQRENDMKHRLAFFAATAAVIFATAGTVQAAPPWQHVRNIGMRQFVVVDPASSTNAEILKQAAQAVCTPAKACVVMFWSEAAAVPTTMPMTRVQQQAVIAQYMRNPASGSEELLLRCRSNEPTAAKCLR